MKNKWDSEKSGPGRVDTRGAVILLGGVRGEGHREKLPAAEMPPPDAAGPGGKGIPTIRKMV